MNTEYSKTNIEDPAFLGRNHLSIINNHLAMPSTFVEEALHLSREHYKSDFLCKTKPICKQSQFQKSRNERKLLFNKGL
jgi:hypothetical protein